MLDKSEENSKKNAGGGWASVGVGHKVFEGTVTLRRKMIVDLT